MNDPIYRCGRWLCILAILQCGIACGQLPDYPDDSVAGIPVNYTEANVRPYTLPDPMTMANGAKVIDANAWQTERRPELVKLAAENQYGRTPGRPEAMRFEVVEEGTPAFDGHAVRKQITIHFGDAESSPAMDLLVYLPVGSDRPVPLLLNIGFSANNLTVDDPAVKVGRVWDRRQNKRVSAEGGRSFGRLRVLPTIQRGFGIATFNYADVDPDAPGAIDHGVRRLSPPPTSGAPSPPGHGESVARSIILRRTIKSTPGGSRSPGYRGWERL
jgi:hypothetical protein